MKENESSESKQVQNKMEIFDNLIKLYERFGKSKYNLLLEEIKKEKEKYHLEYNKLKSEIKELDLKEKELKNKLIKLKKNNEKRFDTIKQYIMDK